MKSDNNRRKVWPLPIAEASGVHAMRHMQVCEALLARIRLPSGPINFDDDRQRVGAPRKYFVEDMLADWDMPNPVSVLGAESSRAESSRVESRIVKSSRVESSRVHSSLV